MRVLCVDIEGGHGGSSRSLFQILSAIDRDDVDPWVWCRSGGAIESAYSDIGIAVEVHPEMPRFTVLERLSRNAIDLKRFFCNRWPTGAKFREALLQASYRVDVVHLNHISLFWVARWLRRQRPALPIVMHNRTRPPKNLVGRWQARVAARTCNAFVHISENERDWLSDLAGRSIPGEVIYNPVRVMGTDMEQGQKAAASLTALCLSNYSFPRGIDRLIDVAVELDRRGDESVKFVVAGDMRLPKGLPGTLGQVADRGGDLATYAEHVGVGDRFQFLGHVSDPEALLRQADVLLKPTREANPWGRDILEALGHGVPVASVGSYNRFVETGETGLLQAEFDASALSLWLMDMASGSGDLAAMRSAARQRISDLCGADRQAARLTALWREAMGA